MEETQSDYSAGIFANRSFRLFYTGQAFSYVGDGLRSLAIPLLVFHLTGSALSLGVTYALEFLPFALAGLVGGSLADRLDRKRLMIGCDFVRCAILLLFVVASLRGFLSLPLIYAGITIIAICAAIFLGGQSTSVPFLVGKHRASQAVSSLIATEQATNLIAPPIGGALFSMGGALPALVVNALTYLISQVAIANVKTLGPDKPATLPTRAEFISDIAEGFRFLSGDAAMRATTLLSLALNFFGMMAMAVYIPFYKVALHASDAQVGVTLGIVALGAIAGSALAGTLATSWPFGMSLCIAYAVDGVIFVPVIFAQNLWVAATFWALASAGGAFEVTQIISWRMRVIPQEKIGRVFGAVRMIALGGVVPGTILGGFLADRLGVRFPIALSTWGFLIVALYAFAIAPLRRDAR
ncbi:MAG: MFS transporter [Candidatus Eremiobacter antarcticus]|nr:MFS transporter [Candidatus Eremiobacteraeota bacterium]MBC5807005.1 MFS transporter [Candidatus Eremiobacteraeota bacterium]